MKTNVHVGANSPKISGVNLGALLLAHPHTHIHEYGATDFSHINFALLSF
jgi:hypothetical protein